MPSIARTYSRYCRAALELLGKEIELNRKLMKITAQTLCERCGISRPTLRKIERGEPNVEIGIVFEAAAIVGVKFFSSDGTQGLQALMTRLNDKVALLPESVRPKKRKESDDAF